MGKTLAVVVVSAFGGVVGCQESAPPNAPVAPASSSSSNDAHAASAAPSVDAVAVTAPAASASAAAPPVTPAPPAPSAAPSPQPTPRGAAMAMLIARTLQAPSKPPANDPRVTGLLNDSQRYPEIDAALNQAARNVCGVSNDEHSPLRTGPSLAPGNIGLAPEVVQIGLAPKPGLPTEERQRSTRGIALMHQGLHECLPSLAQKHASLYGAVIVVTVRAPGGGAPPEVTLPKGSSQELTSCVTGAVGRGLLPEDVPAQLTFTVRVDKQPH